MFFRILKTSLIAVAAHQMFERCSSSVDRMRDTESSEAGLRTARDLCKPLLSKPVSRLSHRSHCDALDGLPEEPRRRRCTGMQLLGLKRKRPSSGCDRCFVVSGQA